MNLKRIKGFTLIELLVVVAIISLLTSVVLASLRDARDKANESKLVQTLNQVQNSLELFKTNTGHYPYGYFQTYRYEWDPQQYYYEDFTSDPNNNELDQSPYIKFQDTFQNVTLLDGTEIVYLNNRLAYDQSWGTLYVCGQNNTQTYDELGSIDAYTIYILYPPTYSFFNKLKRPSLNYFGDPYTSEEWFGVPVACLSS